MAIVCAFFALGVVLSIGQIYFVHQLSGSSASAEFPGFHAVLWASMIVLGLKSVLFFISASALARLFEPGSIWLALATLLFGFPISGIVLSLCSSLMLHVRFQFRYPSDFLSSLDVILGLGIAAYLLLSPRVASLYGTHSRDWILNKTTTIWRWIRGRHLYVD
jgi:hypothetical protein